MGQIIAWLTGGLMKHDVNVNYQTYGEGDVYAIDNNGEYQPSDYDDMEERNDGVRTRRFTPPKVRWILWNVVK